MFQIPNQWEIREKSLGINFKFSRLFQWASSGLSSSMLTIIFNGFIQPPLATSPPLAFVSKERKFYSNVNQEKAMSKGERNRRKKIKKPFVTRKLVNWKWQLPKVVERWGVKRKAWDLSLKQFSNSKQKLNKADIHVSILLSQKGHTLFYGSQSTFYVFILLGDRSSGSEILVRVSSSFL